MTSETDAEFLDSMEAWVTGSLVFKREHRDRLFALARRGAEAAARIERLEAALRIAQRGLDPYASYEAQLDARVVVDGICAALEEK